VPDTASRVLDGIDLAIAKGEFVALLGASGAADHTAADDRRTCFAKRRIDRWLAAT
jgi:ABC-type uncharacterized transport system ATPase component